MKIRHLISPSGGAEHAFCGLAFDAFDSGDHETDDEFADHRPGLRVTCPECCFAIREMRAGTKGVILAPAKEGS